MVQRMLERGTEGLLAVQRQVAAVQASAEEGLTRASSEMRHRLEELHQNQHRHQDLLQVTIVVMLSSHHCCCVPEVVREMPHNSASCIKQLKHEEISRAGVILVSSPAIMVGCWTITSMIVLETGEWGAFQTGSA